MYMGQCKRKPSLSIISRQVKESNALLLVVVLHCKGHYIHYSITLPSYQTDPPRQEACASSISGLGLPLTKTMKVLTVIFALVLSTQLHSVLCAVNGTSLGSCSEFEILLLIPKACQTLWGSVITAITTGAATLKEVATQLCDPTCARVAYDTIRQCYPSATNIATILDQVCATNPKGVKCDGIYGNYTLTQLLDIGLPCYLSTQAGKCDSACSQTLITITNEWGCCLDIYGTAFANKSVLFESFWATCDLIFPATCVGAFSAQAMLTATSALILSAILVVTMAIL